MVKPGAGRVITVTFHHSSGDVIDLVVGSQDTDQFSDSDTIGTTSNHPFWSVDRQEYVQAGQFAIGERLQTFSGDTKRVGWANRTVCLGGNGRPFLFSDRVLFPRHQLQQVLAANSKT